MSSDRTEPPNLSRDIPNHEADKDEHSQLQVQRLGEKNISIYKVLFEAIAEKNNTEFEPPERENK